VTETNRVVWSEGLFLRPQHFQQQQRHVERYVEQRVAVARRNAWGMRELEFDRELLALGKVALRRAAGVFPDGTPFAMPDDDALPAPLELTGDVRAKIVFLALPVRRGGAAEIERDTARRALVRYALREHEARDVTREASDLVPLEVASVSARLVIEGEPVEDFALIPVARVLECRADRQVMLDETFMPTATSLEACPPLQQFAQRVVGMVAQRADELSRIVGGTQAGGVSDLGEFLRLQALNRHELRLRHLSRQSSVHPEELYAALLDVMGDLCTLNGGTRRPPPLPDYVHPQLQPTFEPLIDAVRQALDSRVRLTVVPIEVEARQRNLFVARVMDVSLFEGATFILAGKAQVPAESLRRLLPQMATVAAAPALKRYVESLMPGIPLRSLGSLPPSLPFHAGYEYFELDRTHEAWKELKTSASFGLFVGDGLPGLQLQMWALRG
jgi:type VI secretion system protein ImpJ